MKTKTQKDWLLTTYGKADKIIEAIIIKDRTDQEAQNESFNYVNAQEVKDHSLMNMEVEVKRFMEEFGLKQKEVKDLEGFNGGTLAVSEMCINFGYVWVDKFQKWINKNNSSYDLRDDEVVNYIRETLG